MVDAETSRSAVFRSGPGRPEALSNSRAACVPLWWTGLRKRDHAPRRGRARSGGGARDARMWPHAGGRVCVWAFEVKGFACMQIYVGLKMPSLSMIEEAKKN